MSKDIPWFIKITFINFIFEAYKKCCVYKTHVLSILYHNFNDFFKLFHLNESDGK